MLSLAQQGNVPQLEALEEKMPAATNATTVKSPAVKRAVVREQEPQQLVIQQQQPQPRIIIASNVVGLENAQPAAPVATATAPKVAVVMEAAPAAPAAKVSTTEELKLDLNAIAANAMQQPIQLVEAPKEGSTTNSIIITTTAATTTAQQHQQPHPEPGRNLDSIVEAIKHLEGDNLFKMQQQQQQQQQQQPIVSS